MRFTLVVTCFSLAFWLYGCATPPMTLEEQLKTSRATRNDIRDWSEHMPYLVGLQYADAARRSLQQPLTEVPSASDGSFMVPLVIYDYVIGNRFGSAIGFLDWFNAGMNGEGLKSYHYNRGLGFMAAPNTHYVTFEEGNQPPEPEEITAAWQDANQLFQEVYNRSGSCVVWGWNEREQFAKTYPKDVAGRYKEILYRCPHPVDTDRISKVYVSSWATPAPGLRLVAAVQSQCSVEPEPGERFADDRFCGMKFADSRRPALDSYGREWMELVTTPVPESPHELHVVARYRGETVTLPSPEVKPEYTEFLRSRAYSP